MALSKSDLLTLISTLFPDNLSQDISAEDLREGLTEIIDASYNQVDNIDVVSGLAPWDAGRQYGTGSCVTSGLDIYQANAALTTVGTFSVGEWTLISDTPANLTNYALKDNVIELDNSKWIKSVTTDTSLNSLVTGIYKIEQSTAPFGLTSEYPTNGTSLLMVLRRSSLSETIYICYKLSDFSKYFIKALNNTLWTEFKSNVDLTFSNGLIRTGNTIQLGGTYSNVNLTGVDFNLISSNNINLQTTNGLLVNGDTNLDGKIITDNNGISLADVSVKLDSLNEKPTDLNYRLLLIDPVTREIQFTPVTLGTTGSGAIFGPTGATGVPGSAAVIPNEQVVFGTGTGITSSNSFTFRLADENLIVGNTNLLGINSYASSIIGGASNGLTNSCYSFIAGGRDIGLTTSNQSTIIGGRNNGMFLSKYSSIIGGRENDLSIYSNYSSIIGGRNHNLYLSDRSSIIGGQCNKICTSPRSSIIGGINNVLNNSTNTILLGSCDSNSNGSLFSSILGGWCNNNINSSRSSLIDGISNTINISQNSAIIGGICNNICNTCCSSIIGGNNNTLNDVRTSLIIGGICNNICRTGGTTSFVIYNTLIDSSNGVKIDGSVNSNISGSRCVNLFNSQFTSVIGVDGGTGLTFSNRCEQVISRHLLITGSMSTNIDGPEVYGFTGTQSVGTYSFVIKNGLIINII